MSSRAQLGHHDRRRRPDDDIAGVQLPRRWKHASSTVDRALPRSGGDSGERETFGSSSRPGTSRALTPAPWRPHDQAARGGALTRYGDSDVNLFRTSSITSTSARARTGRARAHSRRHPTLNSMCPSSTSVAHDIEQCVLLDALGGILPLARQRRASGRDRARQLPRASGLVDQRHVRRLESCSDSCSPARACASHDCPAPRLLVVLARSSRCIAHLPGLVHVHHPSNLMRPGPGAAIRRGSSRSMICPGPPSPSGTLQSRRPSRETFRIRRTDIGCLAVHGFRCCSNRPGGAADGGGRTSLSSLMAG